jgi:hypothetical protein
MDPEEPDSGFCTNCGGAGATEYVGDDLTGHSLYAHVGQCLRLSTKRALGFPLIDLTRMRDEQATRDGRA